MSFLNNKFINLINGFTFFLNLQLPIFYFSLGKNINLTGFKLFSLETLLSNVQNTCLKNCKKLYEGLNMNPELQYFSKYFLFIN